MRQSVFIKKANCVSHYHLSNMVLLSLDLIMEMAGFEPASTDTLPKL